MIEASAALIIKGSQEDKLALLKLVGTLAHFRDSLRQ
jgi:hypothetical protein